MSAALLAAMLGTAAPAAAQTYRVTQTWTIGGDGSWDYVIPDPARHRLFIGRQTRLMVVDATDGHLIGEVQGIHGAHGAALAESAGHGFATSGNDSSVAMFDPSTFAVLGRIHAAEDADDIIHDPSSNRVFTFNGDAHSSTVIDPAGTLVTNIPLGGKPESGVADGAGHIFVNIVDNGEVVEIDPRGLAVTRRWSTAPCRQPVAMAIDTTHHRLFSGCRSGVLAVSDYAAGRVVATAPIGSGVDGAAFDESRGDIFASNADGTLTVIHQDDADHYRVTQTVTTGQFGKNMGFDPLTHRIFVVSARFGPMPDSVPAGGRRRPPMVPGSFMILVVERTP